VNSIDVGLGDNRGPADDIFRVAVVGIGCRFPGRADSPAAFWDLLIGKGKGIRPIPTDRWNPDAYYDPDHDALAKGYAKAGGFLDDVFGFDPNFFDLSAREAQAMDPQQRLLLKVAIEAIEDSGNTLAELRGARCGVFVGISNVDYSAVARYRRTSSDIWAGTGTAFSIAANRISHRLNISGPSLAIDTACSSALTAIDNACRHLHEGTCDAALAGGVNAILEPAAFVAFCKANMLSPTDTISAFDKRANGFVRGEGAGLVLLKPLARAYADGDRIYAVIRATNVNQDGYTSTLTAPNYEAQVAMLEELSRRGKIDPRQVKYVEAHGTGTPVGDPIEARAIGRVFGRVAGNATPVMIGSVKPNVGHLEAASGICGFIKSVLSAYHRVIPPTLNFKDPNPNIPMDALNIEVPTEPTAFGEQEKAYIVVNSFGFGGTNASALIETVQRPAKPNADSHGLIAEQSGEAGSRHGPLVIPISAATEPALKKVAQGLSEALKPQHALAEYSVDEIMFALGTQRDHHAERAVVLASDRQDLIGKLDQLALGELPAPVEQNVVPPVVRGRARSNHKIAFTFAGQGGQWWGMGRQLLTQDAIYRRTIEEFDDIFKSISGWSVVEAMLADQQTTRIDEAEVTQAAIFANQIGLLAVWQARGVRPDVVIGHSFGEVAATYAAGGISLNVAANLIHKRGLVRTEIGTQGAMAAVGLSHEQLMPYVPDDNSVTIAAFNGPTMHSLSGDAEPMGDVLARIAADYPTAFVRQLKMDFGWHSGQLDPGEAWFRKELGNIAWRVPNIPVISTVTGRLETRFDNDYWWENLRQPVSYQKAIEFALDLGVDGFLELGPHRTLAALTTGIVQNKGGSAFVVSSLHREQNDHEATAYATASLHVNGVGVDWSSLTRSRAPKGIPLPKYPWEDQILRTSSEEGRQILFVAESHPLLGKRDLGPSPVWTSELNLKTFRYIADHAVQGGCVFPAAGYVEIMVAATISQYGKGTVELENVHFHEALSIDVDDEIILKTELDLDRALVRIFSLRRGSDADWKLCADGYVRRRDITIDNAPLDTSAFKHAPDLDQATFYDIAERHGLNYDRAFKGVHSLWLLSDRSVAAQVLGHKTLRASAGKYIVHPAILDSCFQTALSLNALRAGAWIPGEPLPSKDVTADRLQLALPIGIRRVVVAEAFPQDVSVLFEGSELGGVYTIYGVAGQPIVRVEGLETKALGAAKRTDFDAAAPAVYVENYYPAEHGPVRNLEDKPQEQRWLLLGPETPNLAALTAALTGCGVAVEQFSQHLGCEAGANEFAAFLAEGQGYARFAGVIYAWGLAAKAKSATTRTDAIVAEVERDTLGLIELGKTLDQSREEPHRPVVWVLTNGARSIDASDPISVAGLQQAPLCGLTRTIATECPEFFVRQIDVDEASLAAPQAVAEWLLDEGHETEIVLRDSRVLVPRIERRSAANLPPRRRLLDRNAGDRNFVVTMSQPGLVDNIILREASMPEPDEHELVVDVASVGLNFRDIMAATSILPGEVEGPEAWWRNFGLEFAGTVHACGSKVTGFATGDRVMGMGKGFLRGFAKIPAAAVMRIPANITMADATTIPAGFATAVYALEWVGRLQAGEKVLIHLGTGGVGLAAIQVAKHLGAEILATAGSEAKRAYLRKLGIPHVMDSRSLSFADDVMAATGGRGVDVVLNALAGLAIDKGLACLAPYGRFVEIGKRDLFADKPIGLKSLYFNNSFSVIDLAALGKDRPELMRRLLDVVSERVADGTYRPIPLTQFPVQRTAEAFRTMSKAQHIGKIVVDVKQSVIEVEDDLESARRFDPRATYIVTGGLRGFGVSVADWLSENGAGRVVLVSRRTDVESDVAESIAKMKARGTDIVAASIDVTNPEAVAALIAQHVRSDMPLRGIVHGAAVIEDGFISQLDPDRVRRVIRPKVAGAWNLHRALVASGAELDFFVSFSSLAQFIGSGGQGNYTAANAFLDAFSAYRKQQGLPALAVDWGALGDAGFVARNAAMISYLDSVGMKMISSSEAVGALGKLVRSDLPSIAFAAVDWQQVERVSRRERKLPRLSVVLTKSSGNDPRVRATLMQSPREAWDEILVSAICAEVARVLKVDAGTIPDDRPLTEFGLDSLSSFELKNRIEAMLDFSIPVAKFLQAPTIRDLARVVAESFEGVLAAAERASSKADAGDASAAGQEAANVFRPLSRQISDLRLASLSMTSDKARAALWMRHSELVPQRLELDKLEEAVRRLSAKQDALRLAIAPNAKGEAEIVFADGPKVARLEPGEIPADVSLEAGPLWSFGFSQAGQDQTQITVSSHAAAADSWSLPMAVAQLLAEYENGGGASAKFQSFAAERELRDDSDATAADKAFWAEMLVDAAPAIKFPWRSRALAPVGCGHNRGEATAIHQKVDLAELRAGTAGNREATMLLAFARALVADAEGDSIFICRHDVGRRDCGPADMLGPVADRVPLALDRLNGEFDYCVNRVGQGLASALAHRAFDVSAIEQHFETLLRDKNVVPTQIGFAYVDASSGPRADAGLQALLRDAAVSRLRGDIDLLVLDQGDHMECVWAYDGDVVEREWMQAVARRFTQELLALARDAGSRSKADVRSGAAKVGGEAVEALSAKSSSRLQGVVQKAAGRIVSLMPSRSAGSAAGQANILPASMQQRRILEFFEGGSVHEAFNQAWIVRRALSLRPSVDPNAMRRAVESVVSRHECLRLRFVSESNDWGVVIERPHSDIFTVEEARGTDAAALNRLIAERLAPAIDPIRGPMLQIRLLRTGEQGDVLLLRGHGLVIDEWSLAVILGEIFQAYGGLALDPASPMTHERFLREFGGYGNEKVLAERENYFRNILLPGTPLPKVGRAKKGLRPNLHDVDVTPGAECVVKITRDSRRMLIERARNAGVAETALFLASYAMTIGRIGDVDAVQINLPVANRSHNDLANYVGRVATMMPVQCVLNKGDDVEQLARELQAQMLTSAGYLPVDFAAFNRTGSFRQEQVAAGAFPTQFVGGSLVPEGITKSVPPASVALAIGGNAVDFGNMKVTPVSLASSLVANELALRTHDTGTEFQCKAVYDQTAFGGVEVVEIVRKTFERIADDNIFEQTGEAINYSAFL
jgi:acyl transferase domain-containing protein/NADP-dependent 3-hydroxy acid dehydrogenase YdfG/acyl carrier protein